MPAGQDPAATRNNGAVQLNFAGTNIPYQLSLRRKQAWWSPSANGKSSIDAVHRHGGRQTTILRSGENGNGNAISWNRFAFWRH